MKSAPILLIALSLAACNDASVVGPKKATTSSDPAAAPAPPSILSPHGWGPVRIGMTADKAVDAMGGPLLMSKELGSDCGYIPAPSSKSVVVMIQGDKVSRIEVGDGSDKVLTDTGVAVGATAEQVRAKYPVGLESEPHKYESAPAAYLTWWNRREGAGIRFVVGADGRVEQILVGGPAIRLVEGCS